MSFKPQLSFRNDKQISFLSKNIAISFTHRGHSWSSKIQTVLRDFKEDLGIKSLKQLDMEKINEYVQELKESVENGDITGKTAQTYISALNTILDYTNTVNNTNFQSVSAAENGIHRIIDYSDKSISETTHENFQSYLQEKFKQTGDTKFQALQYAVSLEREFGLRFRESAGLNLNTIEKALETDKLELSRQDWTKNARERTVEIRSEYQKELLSNVKDFLEKLESINLAGAQDFKSYQEIASFRVFADSQRQEFSNNTGEQYNFHGERHAWAQERYTELWQEKTGVSIQAPIQYYSQELQQAGWNGEGMKFYEAVKEFEIKPFWDYVRDQADISIDKAMEIDKEIRTEISEQLGHSRLDVTNTYLGHP